MSKKEHVPPKPAAAPKPLFPPAGKVDPGIKNVGEGQRPVTAKPGTGHGGSGGSSSGGGTSGGGKR